MNKRDHKSSLPLSSYIYLNSTDFPLRKYCIKENIKFLKKMLSVDNAPSFLRKEFGELDHIPSELEDHFAQYGLSIVVDQEKKNEVLIYSSKV